MTGKTDMADRILDQALQMAEDGSWEELRLHAVADALDISLNRVRKHYAQKDDLAEAWFDRADAAVLSRKDPDTPESTEPQRIGQAIMSWLDALSAHRRLTREMLWYKLEPGHIHLQALGVTRISRTVQWFREAADLRSRNLKRIVEESCLTGIYLSTFARWLYDDSPDSERTRRFLDGALNEWFGMDARLRKLCCAKAENRTEVTVS